MASQSDLITTECGKLLNRRAELSTEWAGFREEFLAPVLRTHQLMYVWIEIGCEPGCLASELAVETGQDRCCAAGLVDHDNRSPARRAVRVAVEVSEAAGLYGGVK